MMAGALAAAGPPLLATMTDEQLLTSIHNVQDMLKEWIDGPMVSSEVETNGANTATESAEPTTVNESATAEGTGTTADTPTGSDAGTSETTETERADTSS